MRKNLITFLIVIVTLALTYGLVLYIGVQGFLFAWMLNVVLMMCVFAFTESLNANFLSPYYQEKDWEKKGKIYERVGIALFRNLLVWIGWEKLNKKANPVNNNLRALLLLEHRTKQSELGHLLILFIVFGFTAYVAVNFGFVECVWLLVLNIVLNVYPICLQRYNRPRLRKAITLSTFREERFQSSTLPASIEL